MIDEEAQRIAEAIGKKYREDKMSAVDLGNNLEFLSQYSKLTKRCLKNMQNMEFGLQLRSHSALRINKIYKDAKRNCCVTMKKLSVLGVYSGLQSWEKSFKNLSTLP